MPSLNIGFDLAGLCGNGWDYSLPAKRKLLVTVSIGAAMTAAVVLGMYLLSW